MVVLKGRLPSEVGAVVVKALEAASDALYKKDRERSVEHRRVEALKLIAEAALKGELDPGNSADGKFRFTHPRGWVIPEVPSPAKPPDKPLTDIELEGWEGRPKWGYDPIDLPLVVNTMWLPRSSPE